MKNGKATGKLIGYARVSTSEQELRVQLDALKRAGCWNIYQEKASAFRPGRKRKQLELALIDLRPNDTLVVWKLDRLGRNVLETIKLLDRVRATGAGFKSLCENIDMATAAGRLMFHFNAALAEYESAQTAERTVAGIKAIQERGLRIGPKPKLSAARADALVRMRESGASIAATAERFGVSTSSVRNYTLRAKKRKK